RLEQHRPVRPDRHRDAAHAAHREDARDQRKRPEADLHRLSAESWSGRAAAADRRAARSAAAGGRPGSGARAGAPARTWRADGHRAAWQLADSWHGPGTADAGAY